MFMILTDERSPSKLFPMPRSTSIALYRDIGRAVRRLRDQRKPEMSQQVLADAIGLSRASVANIERGHHRIQIHVLYDIAGALDIEPHDLLPHPNRKQPERRLPEDINKALSPKERVAIGRFLERREGDAH